MMKWAGVGENELAQRGEIQTEFGEKLSWEYLCYVRELTRPLSSGQRKKQKYSMK